jgi:photosystem II stability/assembly factor-like uncharacterized protein
MKSYFIFINLIFIFSRFESFAQTVEILNEGQKISLRGLSVVSDKVIWVSGTDGNVGRSTDGGKTWFWKKVTGYESRDFRDIEAFSVSGAVIMAVGEPAVILKTVDGGANWKKVYENYTKGMFLDAMEFWNEQSGIVVGDPVNGRFFIARTFDEGDTWREIAFDKLPVADSGEACFAASGTNVRALDRDEACFVSGGRVSRLFWKHAPVSLPLLQGVESQGANSIAVWNRKTKIPQIVIVGGDFANDTSKSGNCTLSRDGGKTWIKPTSLPNGYRSCVEYISAKRLITCGLNGVDISYDGGIHWNSISSTGFHVCRKAKEGDAVFLAGGNGRIAKLIW